MRRASAVLAIAALSALGLAACGGGGDENNQGNAATSTPAQTTAEGGGGGTTAAGGGGGGTTVDISTPSGSDLAYDQKDASAKAGSVTIDFDNKQATPHDVTIEDSGGTELGKTDLISSQTTSTTVDLQPGTYTFFCSVPGHREAGMEGTLTVK
jgi:plastocyanin